MEVAAPIRAISQAGAPAPNEALIPGESAPKGEEGEAKFRSSFSVPQGAQSWTSQHPQWRKSPANCPYRSASERKLLTEIEETYKSMCLAQCLI